ncbi:uncharacterized protein MONBRDRAFT_29777 [Monosiga brevicollis MX1]|uniref:Uncharacterized protein n=1 Tax=Monosiga brevicollis TaxID=81824 RepID=A9VC35_MONBE|nr:uncharacterized protein MONBRDRAFT_29777 [Monosiga brevicollis MX1]EDQ84912.1 predicted protein [Monosiga brevicollis MX1]|eukprot:XP_001750253.1 hypothetical protein [Monosiga brevicollis MX1]
MNGVDFGGVYLRKGGSLSSLSLSFFCYSSLPLFSLYFCFFSLYFCLSWSRVETSERERDFERERGTAVRWRSHQWAGHVCERERESECVCGRERFSAGGLVLVCLRRACPQQEEGAGREDGGCTGSMATPLVLEGWFLKRKPTLWGWDRRWFKVIDGQVMYFVQEHDDVDRRKGGFSLQDIEDVVPCNFSSKAKALPQQQQRYARQGLRIEVYRDGSLRSYELLCLEREEVYETWLNLLDLRTRLLRENLVNRPRSLTTRSENDGFEVLPMPNESQAQAPQRTASRRSVRFADAGASEADSDLAHNAALNDFGVNESSDEEDEASVSDSPRPAAKGAAVISGSHHDNDQINNHDAVEDTNASEPNLPSEPGHSAESQDGAADADQSETRTYRSRSRAISVSSARQIKVMVQAENYLTFPREGLTTVGDLMTLIESQLKRQPECLRLWCLTFPHDIRELPDDESLDLLGSLTSQLLLTTSEDRLSCTGVMIALKAPIFAREDQVVAFSDTARATGQAGMIMLKAAKASRPSRSGPSGLEERRARSMSSTLVLDGMLSIRAKGQGWGQRRCRLDADRIEIFKVGKLGASLKIDLDCILILTDGGVEQWWEVLQRRVPVVSKQGWLSKRGELNTKWKRRWFELRGRSLFYGPEKGIWKARINLARCDNVIIADEDDVDDSFVFYVVHNQRTYSIRADNEHSLLDWVQILRMCLPDQRVLHQGRLHKLGVYNRTFKPRFFQLTPSRLLYFDDETYSRCKGQIDLSLVRKAEPFSGSGGFHFAINAQDRAFELRADTDAQRQQWIGLINDAIAALLAASAASAAAAMLDPANRGETGTLQRMASSDSLQDIEPSKESTDDHGRSEGNHTATATSHAATTAHPAGRGSEPARAPWDVDVPEVGPPADFEANDVLGAWDVGSANQAPHWSSSSTALTREEMDALAASLDAEEPPASSILEYLESEPFDTRPRRSMAASVFSTSGDDGRLSVSDGNEPNRHGLLMEDDEEEEEMLEPDELTPEVEQRLMASLATSMTDGDNDLAPPESAEQSEGNALDVVTPSSLRVILHTLSKDQHQAGAFGSGRTITRIRLSGCVLSVNERNEWSLAAGSTWHAPNVAYDGPVEQMTLPPNVRVMFLKDLHAWHVPAPGSGALPSAAASSSTPASLPPARIHRNVSAAEQRFAQYKHTSLLANLKRAVRILTDFVCAADDAEDDQQNGDTGARGLVRRCDDMASPKIGSLVRQHFCSAMAHIFVKGLQVSRYGGFFKTTVWDVLVALTPAPSAATSSMLRKAYLVVRDLQQNPNMNNSNDVRVRSFFCAALTHHFLEEWLQAVYMDKPRLAKWYKPESFWCMCPQSCFEELLLMLTPLHGLPFRLHTSWERTFAGRGADPMGATDSYNYAMEVPAGTGMMASEAELGDLHDLPLVQALYDNDQPADEAELVFERGDILRVIKVLNEDWLKCELNGQEGIVPCNYVEELDQMEAELYMLTHDYEA